MFYKPSQTGQFNWELDLNSVRLLVKTENDRKTGQTLQTVNSTGITKNHCDQTGFGTFS